MMAMSKEEQKAASDRIMAKLGPMTPEEQAMYELLTKRPEDYMPPNPKTGERACGVCGEVFENTLSPKGDVLVSALEKFSDHQTEHNPNPAQWAEAHSRIQAGKEQSKGRE
jgi:hypothetical protein